MRTLSLRLLMSLMLLSLLSLLLLSGSRSNNSGLAAAEFRRGVATFCALRSLCDDGDGRCGISNPARGKVKSDAVDTSDTTTSSTTEQRMVLGMYDMK